MCERPPFWRWLSQGLVEKIRALPRLIGDPLSEIIIGIIGITCSLILSPLALTLTFNERVIIALCSIPSFIILMHGIYRAEEDC